MISRPAVEAAVRPMISGQGLPKIVRPLGIGRLRRHLAIEAVGGEVAVAQAGHDLIALNRDDSRRPDKHLAATLMGRPVDRAGGHLGLEDRRHRLRLARQAAFDPAELRRVEAGICTIVIQTRLLSCSNSQRTDSVNP